MKNPKINESLIIGVDFSKRDDGVLIVGRQKNGGGNDGSVKTSGTMPKMPV